MSRPVVNGPADQHHQLAALVPRLDDGLELPADPVWHDHAVLVADLATVNRQLSRYIIDVLDSDARRGDPVSSTQEAALGRQLVELGHRLQARAHDLSREPPHPGSG